MLCDAGIPPSPKPLLAPPAAETMKLSDASRAARERQAEVVNRFEERRRMAEVVVPVKNSDVRALLRKMEQPVTLFGEMEMDRRDRLRRLLAGMDEGQREAVTGQVARCALRAPCVPLHWMTYEGDHGDACAVFILGPNIVKCLIVRMCLGIHPHDGRRCHRRCFP